EKIHTIPHPLLAPNFDQEAIDFVLRDLQRKKEKQTVAPPIGYNIEAAIAQILNFGEDGARQVRYDTLTYISEHVWQQLITPVPYYLQKKPFSEKTFLTSPNSSNPEAPVIEMFQNAIALKNQEGQNAQREMAEVIGFAKIEEACRQAFQKNKRIAFLWFSPPGETKEDYGKTGRTFLGIFEPSTGFLNSYALIDNFNNQERNSLAEHFSGQKDQLAKDTDFLLNPQIVEINPAVNVEDIINLIDSYLTQAKGEKHFYGKPIASLSRFADTVRENPLFEAAKPFLEPIISNIIDLMGHNTNRQKIYQALNALSHFAKKLQENFWENNGQIILESQNYKLTNLITTYGHLPVLIEETSCPAAQANLITSALSYPETNLELKKYCLTCKCFVPIDPQGRCVYCHEQL
ncbi:hypothetical protein GYA19_01960, partial [Candidatus Beckwithbacteria bacterium]|nr:hypothetical protein [Candidatus Beckwithbacteria bacterium]